MRKLALACSLALGLALTGTQAYAWPDEPATQPKSKASQPKASQQKEDKTAALDKHDVEMPKKGIAVLIATQGNKVSGMIKFDQRQDQLHITGTVRGLTPGKHGFHVHEFGDLSAADGTAAGDHFAPHGHKHGDLNKEESHAGDLGNITANEDGVAEVDIQSKALKLHFILGRTIVVHGGEDDLKSQPSGNSGPRVALGVIGLANTKSASPEKTTQKPSQTP